MTAPRTALWLALLLAPLPAAAGAPDWATVPRAPAAGARDTNVVVLRDVLVRVAPDGSVTMRTRVVEHSDVAWAAGAARLAVPYVRGTSRVRTLHAWTIAPDGRANEWKDDRAVDLAIDRDALFSDSRAMILDAGEGVTPGATLATETVVESAPGIAALQVPLQEREATTLTRVSLLLPPGWEGRATPLHDAAVTATRAGDTLQWIARDLPAIPEERLAVPFADHVPMLGIAWTAPAPVAGTTSVHEWRDVAAWYVALADERTHPGPGVEAAARTLAPADAGAWEVAKRLAEEVQHIRYVAIEIGIGRFQPHAAEDVLRDGYGDCKDKAGLLRALLAARGVRAWMVLANAGDPLAVEERWPSPLQFDHCIVAIALPGAEHRAAGLVHATLGSLLFFDPTDPYTPFGDLPASERGGLVVLAAEPGGGAVRLPDARPARDGIERDVEMRLALDGSADVRVAELARGDEAVRRRAERAALGPDAFQRALAAWSDRGLPGTAWSDVRVADAPDSNTFRIELSGHARVAGRALPGGAVSLPPIALSRLVVHDPFPTPRATPLRLPRVREHERLRVLLPAGWRADDLPDAVARETAAGRFTLACAVQGDTVRCESGLELAGGRLPAARFGEFGQLLEAATAAGRTSFVASPPGTR